MKWIKVKWIIKVEIILINKFKEMAVIIIICLQYHKWLLNLKFVIFFNHILLLIVFKIMIINSKIKVVWLNNSRVDLVIFFLNLLNISILSILCKWVKILLWKLSHLRALWKLTIIRLMRIDLIIYLDFRIKCNSSRDLIRVQAFLILLLKKECLNRLINLYKNKFKNLILRLFLIGLSLAKVVIPNIAYQI